LCHDEIIVEINSRNESNENSDIDNGEIVLQHDDYDEEDEEETNSEQKLLKSNHTEVITVKAQVEKSMHNGVNGIDDICIKLDMGW
jgi:hypothetical protein